MKRAGHGGRHAKISWAAATVVVAAVATDLNAVAAGIAAEAVPGTYLEFMAGTASRCSSSSP